MNPRKLTLLLVIALLVFAFFLFDLDKVLTLDYLKSQRDILAIGGRKSVSNLCAEHHRCFIRHRSEAHSDKLTLLEFGLRRIFLDRQYHLCTAGRDIN